jgi:DNA invertase Pin-like site-specific DNA recombinase
MAMRAALYVRVSTDQQTVENQERELREVAERRGWTVAAEHVFKDEGISGAKGRDKRPGLDAMLTAASRRRFDVVLVWALDRLGRSLVGLLTTIQALEDSKVELYIASMSMKGGEPRVVDTTDPRDKLLFQITAAFSEFERSLINQRIKAGVDRVRAELSTKGSFTSRKGVHRTRFGRPGAEPEAIEKARKLLAGGMGIRKAATETKLGVGTVHKLAREMRAKAA